MKLPPVAIVLYNEVQHRTRPRDDRRQPLVEDFRIDRYQSGCPSSSLESFTQHQLDDIFASPEAAFAAV